MLAPILRTYVNPDAGDNVVTASVPHVMCYAPNVSTTEIGVTPTAEQLRDFIQHGAWLQTPAPFVIHQGRTDIWYTLAAWRKGKRSIKRTRQCSRAFAKYGTRGVCQLR
jgi:hypothetical protein